MSDEILGHKDLFSFHKKNIVVDSSLAPHAKSFADVVLNKKTMVVSKDVQKSTDVPVKKIFTSLASNLDKDNTLMRFGNMEDEVEIVNSLEKNKAHYDKDDELAAIDEKVNTKEDVALNHDSEHISNMDKVVNTEIHEEHIEAPTTE
ncbi:hypothetical protein PanWU01x14_340000, partial [Parasponia andersonii]